MFKGNMVAIKKVPVRSVSLTRLDLFELKEVWMFILKICVDIK